MTQLASPLLISSSRRRFVTFGGALILAACLTLVKIALLAMDVGSQGMSLSAYLGDPLASIDAAFPRPSQDKQNPVPWPTNLPEPAAGPAEEQDGVPLTPESLMSDGTMEPKDERPSAIDPSALTEGQIQALQQLAARRQKLDERERLLDMKAELNGRTAERLDQQIRQLVELKEQLESLTKGLDEAEEQKLSRLVKIYETMKPKSAAEIFNRLEIPVLLHVVERMKEAKSAVVLGKMDPAIAKRVTTELARRKERPTLGGQDLGS